MGERYCFESVKIGSMKKEGIGGEVSIPSLETRIHQAKIGWFIIAGLVSSMVSIPAGLTLLGLAGYQFIKMREASNAPQSVKIHRVQSSPLNFLGQKTCVDFRNYYL